MTQDDLENKVRKIIIQLDEIKEDFGDKPEYEHYRYAFSRVTASLTNIADYEAKRHKSAEQETERYELAEKEPETYKSAEQDKHKGWIRKEYKGFPNSPLIKVRASNVAEYLAEKFGENSFTYTNTLNGKFVEKCPYSRDWGVYSSLKTAIRNFYNKGILERNGFGGTESYRFIPQAFKDLSINLAAAN